MSTFNIPEEATKSGESRFINKIENGDTVLSFGEKAVIGWEAWKEEDGKSFPVRTPYDKPFTDEQTATFKQPQFGDPVNLFLAAVVFDHADNKVKIFNVNKKTIIKALRDIDESADWGGVDKATIKITKTGEKLQTEYTVMPTPRKELSDEVIEEMDSVNLNALFDGTDPFGGEKDDVDVAPDF